VEFVYSTSVRRALPYYYLPLPRDKQTHSYNGIIVTHAVLHGVISNDLK